MENEKILEKIKQMALERMLEGYADALDNDEQIKYHKQNARKYYNEIKELLGVVQWHFHIAKNAKQ